MTSAGPEENGHEAHGSPLVAQRQKHPLLDHDEEEETLSSAGSPSTTMATPETPVFKTTTKNGNGETAGECETDGTFNNLQEEQQTRPLTMMMPSLLLNGPQYEQSLDRNNNSQIQNQQRVSQTTVPTSHPPPTSNKHRPSFLKDQFSMDDDDGEEPLTLEDYSQHDSTSGEEQQQDQQEKAPLLGLAAAAQQQPQQQLQEPLTDHPLLRHRKNSTSHRLDAHTRSLSPHSRRLDGDRQSSSPMQRHDDRPRLVHKLSIPRKYGSPIREQQHKKDDDNNYQNDNFDDLYPQPDDFPNATATATTDSSGSPSLAASSASSFSMVFYPHYTVAKYLQTLSQLLMRSPNQYDPTAAATWIGFWALFLVTCSNYVLMPMRDAIALAVGVEYIPKLTLASTVLALFSSVPIGWLFEAPDPQRRKVWKKLGLTRGETQGSSLALFYRFFALTLMSYAIGFKGVEFLVSTKTAAAAEDGTNYWLGWVKIGLGSLGQAMYIAFFLVVHLMKLHSLSLVWGVTTEAMEYEETARKRYYTKLGKDPPSSKIRLQRLAFVGFGGTVGGILGSMIASGLARVLRLSGLLVVSAMMLEAAAQLAIELGRIMHKHWMQQQLFPSTDNLAALDASMKRSASVGSMKRISSGNSLNRVKSMSEMPRNGNSKNSLASLEKEQEELQKQQVMDDSFSQRLLRGITTILQSRLLMAIFTYNALYASTTVLLSFQRAELVANRKADTTTEADTAFLANINMASSVAVFALQSSGVGAYVAHKCGTRGTLALMPLIRVIGVMALAYWHHTSNGAPPNLLLFLLLDECCRVMNMAVAKPVRESLWRGLSNEARYEAKPIVDTLANRWGGGSAAFLVSSINKLLDLFGVPQPENGDIRVVFGFPPVLFLCMIVATWWAGVSADLGQIRRRIDLELKKMQ